MNKEVGTFHIETENTCSPRPQLFRACNQRNNNVEVAAALTIAIQEEL
jgi:hypothetical protein